MRLNSLSSRSAAVNSSSNHDDSAYEDDPEYEESVGGNPGSSRRPMCDLPDLNELDEWYNPEEGEGECFFPRQAAYLEAYQNFPHQILSPNASAVRPFPTQAAMVSLLLVVNQSKPSQYIDKHHLSCAFQMMTIL